MRIYRLIRMAITGVGFGVVIAEAGSSVLSQPVKTIALLFACLVLTDIASHLDRKGQKEKQRGSQG